MRSDNERKLINSLIHDDYMGWDTPGVGGEKAECCICIKCYSISGPIQSLAVSDTDFLGSPADKGRLLLLGRKCVSDTENAVHALHFHSHLIKRCRWHQSP